MTVSSSTSKVSYSGNGSLTVFAYTFKIFDQDDLTVILRASDGTETVQTITTHYTVSGVGSAGGGNVTFVTAPASGVTVVILREQPLTQELDLVPNDPFPAQSLEESLDKLVFMVQAHSEELDRAIKASKTNTISSSEFTISAADRANKVFSFDASGDLAVTQELGIWKGDWATSTTYVVRDIIKDASNNNVYICVTAHTSSGSTPISSNADSAKWALLVDAASATSSASAAAASETAAQTAQTAAEAAQTAAETAQTAAETAQTGAETAETNAETAQAAAEAAQAAAELAYDNFDDRYLGAKASDPTLDNDGAALIDGALYFDTTNNVMKVYDLGGTAWRRTTPTTSDQTNINTVSGIAANVTTVAGISGNVTTVAGISADVTTVAADGTDIGIVAGISSNVTTVAGISANVTTVAGISSAVTTVAADGTDIGVVAGISSDVSTVSGISGNVTTVAGISANVTTVAGISANVTTVAGDTANIGTIATNLNGTDTIGTVAGSISNVNSVGGSIANVNTVATNLTSINSFANTYRIGTTDPTTSLDTGDLFYNTSSSVLKVYNGTAWEAGVTAGSGFLPLTGGTMTGALDVQSTITADGLTVDGNVGIGLTAPTISEGFQLHVDAAGNGLWGGFGNTYLTANYKFNSGNKFAGTGYAQVIETVPSTGAFTFKSSSASGTADATATMQSRMNIASNGDISFYEDTGTTAKFFWDASAESLGIGAGDINLSGVGTASQNVVTTIQGNAQFRGILELANSTGVSSAGASAGDIAWFDNDNKIAQISGLGQDTTNHDDGELAFSTTSGGTLSERMRIDSSGNVGIGTSSPLSKLEVNSGDIRINDQTNGATRKIFFDMRNSGGAQADLSIQSNNGNLLFYNESVASERMRIDSSGNLLVGKTSGGNTNTVGFEVQSNGFVGICGDGIRPVQINRKTSDGDIIEFRKDGTTVGRIGTNGGRVYFADDAQGGIALASSAPALTPVTSSGALSDGSMNIGGSSYRFKDLYLGGGVVETTTTVTYAASIALTYDNGSIQTVTLTGNVSFTDSLADGESVVLMLNAGASYTVIWPTLTWTSSSGNVAPTLTANDTLVFWKIGTTLYGAYAGSYT